MPRDPAAVLHEDALRPWESQGSPALSDSGRTQPAIFLSMPCASLTRGRAQCVPTVFLLPQARYSHLESLLKTPSPGPHGPGRFATLSVRPWHWDFSLSSQLTIKSLPDWEPLVLARTPEGQGLCPPQRRSQEQVRWSPNCHPPGLSGGRLPLPGVLLACVLSLQLLGRRQAHSGESRKFSE